MLSETDAERPAERHRNSRQAAAPCEGSAFALAKPVSTLLLSRLGAWLRSRRKPDQESETGSDEEDATWESPIFGYFPDW